MPTFADTTHALLLQDLLEAIDRAIVQTKTSKCIINITHAHAPLRFGLLRLQHYATTHSVERVVERHDRRNGDGHE
jgi:hypothetical protein